MHSDSFISAVHTILTSTTISELLAAKDAIVLERIARGGGATNWYHCLGRNQLQSVVAHLSPGSAVSFYFDDRIRHGPYSPELKSDVERILRETGEAIIGVLDEDRLHIDVEIISGAGELAEFVSTLSLTSRVFYGAFPARDNDGVRAVTVILPDDDGVIRNHPH